MPQATSLRAIVERELSMEEIDLPIIDTLAVSLGQMLRKDDVEFDDLAKVIERDPSLTAKVLHLSNSVFYAGLVKIKSVDRAIARVGLMPIRSFLMTVSLKGAFKGTGPYFQEGFKMNWRHSLGCAVCAKRIAEHMKMRSLSEDAYLLGLLHDIGTTSIFNALSKVSKEQDEHADMNEDLVREIISSFHAPIGSKVLARLNFDEHFCRIVEQHHAPDDYPDKNDALFNILYVANKLLTRIGIHAEPDPNISLVSLLSTAKLGLDPLFIAMLEVDLEDSMQDVENLL